MVTRENKSIIHLSLRMCVLSNISEESGIDEPSPISSLLCCVHIRSKDLGEGKNPYPCNNRQLRVKFYGSVGFVTLGGSQFKNAQN